MEPNFIRITKAVTPPRTNELSEETTYWLEKTEPKQALSKVLSRLDYRDVSYENFYVEGPPHQPMFYVG